MYGIFIYTFIYHKIQPNVSKYIVPMDPMDMDVISPRAKLQEDPLHLFFLVKVIAGFNCFLPVFMRVNIAVDQDVVGRCDFSLLPPSNKNIQKRQLDLYSLFQHWGFCDILRTARGWFETFR